MNNFFNICCPPDAVIVQTDSMLLQAKYEDITWVADGTLLSTEVKQDLLSVTLLSTEAPVKRVQLRWNRVIPPLSILGDHWERGYGDLEWRGMVPERVLPWYFVAWDGSQAAGCGVMTAPNAMCFWQVDSKGISLWLDTRCGAAGFIPSSPVELCNVMELCCLEGESTFAAASRLCKLLCPNPRLPASPVYGGNNWYYAYGKSSHQEILDDSKRVVDLSPGGSNRPFMVIDDGWQQHHSQSFNGGPWGRGNNDFPDMAGLAAEMKQSGARPGIWLRALLTCSDVPAQWLLPRQRFLAASDGPMLDPSVPEVLQMIKQEFSTIEGWGYELIKHDYSTYDILGRWGYEMHAQVTSDDWRFYDKSKTTAQIIKGFYSAIRESVNNKTLLLGCNTISHLSAGYFELQRTGDDTSGREWERTRKMGINTLAFRMPQHDAFYACDGDCVGLTDLVPWELNSQWLDLLARSGTPLFVSAQPSAMGKEQRKAVMDAFDTASHPREVAVPLDWMQTTCPERWQMAEGIVEYNWFGNGGLVTV